MSASSMGRGGRECIKRGRRSKASAKGVMSYYHKGIESQHDWPAQTTPYRSAKVVRLKPRPTCVLSIQFMPSSWWQGVKESERRHGRNAWVDALLFVVSLLHSFIHYITSSNSEGSFLIRPKCRITWPVLILHSFVVLYRRMPDRYCVTHSV